MSKYTVGGGVLLAAEELGDGTPVVLLHGLTATRRYIVMGSKLLEREGFRVISYDARGHGESAPAPDPRAYGYEHLVADLERVLDDVGADRVVLAGVSMGAQTAVRFALEYPERVSALCLITPGFDPRRVDDHDLKRWDSLAKGLREGGVEGFIEAYDVSRLSEAWRETALRVIRQRLERHEHPEAVADALRYVPRSRPFHELRDLAAIGAPTVVIGDRDEADLEHPLELAQAWARAMPTATLVVEDPGDSPLAWQGSQVSGVVAGLARAVR